MQHGVAVADWVIEEFGGLDLGDTRREARVLEVVSQLAARPGGSLPVACRDLAALKATYRLLDNEAVSREALLSGHVAATWARVAAEPVVLAVQDTTDLDFSSHRATGGLGRIGNGYGQGLYVHTTLAITPERLPLGLLGQQVWARPSDRPVSATAHKKRPLAEKESRKWLEGLAVLAGAPEEAPSTQVISVADREADVYAVFTAPRRTGVELLIRATQDRTTTVVRTAAAPPRRGRRARHTLRSLLAEQPGTPQVVEVPRRGPQRPRTAQVELRWAEVTLPGPTKCPKAERVPVTLRVVWAREVAPPAGVAAPLDWLLLTTLNVPSAAAAQQVVEYYLCRWGIEVWHKVLKTGCAFEQRQLGHADNLQRALSIYSVIAWWVLYATLLARLAPDVPCTVLLELDEWQALFCAVHKTPSPPAQPPTLRQAVRWTAQLGGFLGRNGDAEPGPLTLWRGMARLLDMTEMFRILTASTRHDKSG
jgi:hypothetical protein